MHTFSTFGWNVGNGHWQKVLQNTRRDTLFIPGWIKSLGSTNQRRHERKTNKVKTMLGERHTLWKIQQQNTETSDILFKITFWGLFLYYDLCGRENSGLLGVGYKVYFLSVQLSMTGALCLHAWLSCFLKRAYITPKSLSLARWCCCPPTQPPVMRDGEMVQGAGPAVIPHWFSIPSRSIGDEMSSSAEGKGTGP